MNNRGQEFAGFRLLVEAIMAVFILIIVLSALAWVENQKFIVSDKRVRDGFFKAVNSPDGSVILEENLYLNQGNAYTATAFAGHVNIPKECIEFDARDSSAFTVLPTAVRIEQVVQVNVYYKCLAGGSADCRVYCTISFGKELEPETQ